MGKPIDQLKLDDTPIAPSAATTEQREQAEQFLIEISDLLNTGRYHWAEQTLGDIYDTVEKTARVTDGQRRAVHNIEQAAVTPGRRRRYEAWHR